MQYAVTHILSDDGGPEKVIAVVDGRGAAAESEHRPRYVRQAKHLASILTQVSLAAVMVLSSSFWSVWEGISCNCSARLQSVS